MKVSTDVSVATIENIAVIQDILLSAKIKSFADLLRSKVFISIFNSFEIVSNSIIKHLNANSIH